MPLEGQLITLRELRTDDIPMMTMLRNDLDTQAWTKTLPPDYTEEMVRNRYMNKEFSVDRMDALFIIVWKETGEAAGFISYSGLKPRLSATIGIVVRKEFWGTQTAYDAQDTLLRFLFEELGLWVVRLWTNSGNPAAVRSAEKVGFSLAASQRAAVWRRGKLYDNIIMDMLREEFYERHPDLRDNLPPVSG